MARLADDQCAGVDADGRVGGRLDLYADADGQLVLVAETGKNG
jgi:hypothetical protein